MTDNMVFLAYKNNKMPSGEKSLGSCKSCKNKTFITRYDAGEFPILVCAACELQMGSFGWVQE